MRKTIEETQRRRKKQIEYNYKHKITPRQIIKETTDIFGGSATGKKGPSSYIEPGNVNYAADPVFNFMSDDQLQRSILKTRRSMEKAAKELDFIEAARLRDELYALEKMLKERRN